MKTIEATYSFFLKILDSIPDCDSSYQVKNYGKGEVITENLIIYLKEWIDSPSRLEYLKNNRLKKEVFNDFQSVNALNWIFVFEDERKTKQFQVGDVVQLNSGGPYMTVGRLGKDTGRDYVVCSWFNKAGQVSRSEFYLSSIKSVGGN